ncbi:MAG: 30S ribosomal protein S1 [Bacteroidia bacterium]|nr:30S ribosomal protein S1 [Bacteroidia bacterium]MCX7652046.1 30S ribosomal protein S1 [Bacteroidia bacterium]MDW8416283.1 30S ribosomal protein S1 [Bacteroidia bacterium]
MSQASEIDLKQLYESYSPPRIQNAIVKGRIVAVDKSEVLVSIGHKAEGHIPLSEWASDEPPPRPGDEIEVYVETADAHDGGMRISRRLAHSLRTWEFIQQALQNDTPIEGVIRRRTKGGFVVDIGGIEAFLPGSQVDLKPLRASDTYEELLGKRMRFKVVKINPAQYNVVVSHKTLMEEELARQKERILNILERGQVLEGVVKNVASFGIFVDLGGVMDGLVHVSDLSWGRVSHPEELYKIGDKVQVVVLDYDPDTGRVNLGIKQLYPNPWEAPPDWLQVGAVIEGTIVAIADYGVTVEVIPGIEGLLPVFELSWSATPVEVAKLYKVGDKIQAKVIQFEPETQRLTLSVKQLSPDPWLHAAERYPVGSTHKGVVKNYTAIGAFVELEPGVEGFVNVRDLSWIRRVRHPSEILRRGQEIEVVVLDVDAANKRLRLGYKQLSEDPWEMIRSVFHPESYHEGLISRITDVGAQVELAFGVEGFCPIHYLKSPTGEMPKEGETVLFKVIELDEQNRTIVLAQAAQRPARKSKKKKDEAAEEAAPIEPSTRVASRQKLGDLEAIAQLRALLSQSNQ